MASANMTSGSQEPADVSCLNIDSPTPSESTFSVKDNSASERTEEVNSSDTSSLPPPSSAEYDHTDGSEMVDQLLSCPYRADTSLNVHLENSYSPSLQSNTEAVANVLKPFEPFSMSLVMLVRIKGLEVPAVLKLYDRRYCPQLRKNLRRQAWNEQREGAFREFLESGAAAGFVEHLHHKGEDWVDYIEAKDSWSPDQIEILMHEDCLEFYNNEISAYRNLDQFLNRSVPRLLATVSLKAQPTTDPNLQQYFDVPGILLEYIDGFCLTDLPDKAPKECWPSICDDAVSMSVSVSGCNILNRDVRPDNVVVRKIQSKAGIRYEPMMLDFGHSDVRGPDESDVDWEERKRDEDEENALGFIMQIILKKRGYEYAYERSYRWGRETETGVYRPDGTRLPSPEPDETVDD